MSKDDSDSVKHSVHSDEEEKQEKKKDKIEKPLKVKIPKNKHSFTVIGKLAFKVKSNLE
jgi:hypothetical protein